MAFDTAILLAELVALFFGVTTLLHLA